MSVDKVHTCFKVQIIFRISSKGTLDTLHNNFFLVCFITHAKSEITGLQEGWRATVVLVSFMTCSIYILLCLSPRCCMLWRNFSQQLHSFICCFPLACFVVRWQIYCKSTQLTEPRLTQRFCCKSKILCCSLRVKLGEAPQLLYPDALKGMVDCCKFHPVWRFRQEVMV